MNGLHLEHVICNLIILSITEKG